MLVRITHDPSDAFQLCELFRRPLRVAPRNQNLGFRALPSNAPDRGARILIGARSHSAGVQYDKFCLFCIDTLHSFRRKLAFDCGAVCLGCAASKVLNVVTAHGVIINAREIRTSQPKLLLSASELLWNRILRFPVARIGWSYWQHPWSFR